MNNFKDHDIVDILNGIYYYFQLQNNTDMVRRRLSNIGNVKVNYINYNNYKITVASMLIELNNQMGFSEATIKEFPYVYVAGHSYCSPKDKFSKKRGKEYAYTRLYLNYLQYRWFLIRREEKCNLFLNRLWKAFTCVDEFAPRILLKDKNIYVIGKAYIELNMTRLDNLSHESNK